MRDHIRGHGWIDADDGNLLVQGKNILIKDIEVVIDGELEPKNVPPQPAARTFLNHEYVCSYSVSASDGDWVVWGTADPQESIIFTPFFMEKFKVNYTRLHSNKHFRQAGEKIIGVRADETLSMVNICPKNL